MKLLLNQLRILGNFADRKKSDLQFLILSQNETKLLILKQEKSGRYQVALSKTIYFTTLKTQGNPLNRLICLYSNLEGED